MGVDNGTAKPSIQDDTAQIYRDFYRGLIEQDVAALDTLLDVSFVLTHMTGMKQNKQAFLSAVGDGTLRYYEADHKRINVRVEGTEAFLTGDTLVRAAVFGGGVHDWPLRLEMHLKKQNGRWQICSLRASEY